MARYLRLLPVAFIALAMQILAPVAACWAAALAASDPLASASICHDSGTTGQNDESSRHLSGDCGCGICCVSYAGPEPKSVAFLVVDRRAEHFIWLHAATVFSWSRAGSNAQARAPPQLT